MHDVTVLSRTELEALSERVGATYMEVEAYNQKTESFDDCGFEGTILEGLAYAKEIGKDIDPTSTSVRYGYDEAGEHGAEYEVIDWGEGKYELVDLTDEE